MEMTLVGNGEQYAFLGPIVGIAGLLLGAGTAILFGWTQAFDKWKPPADVLPQPLSRMVTMLCALGVFMAWILAEPNHQADYVRIALWLCGISVVLFLAYVGLWAYCGRFRKPQVNSRNQPETDPSKLELIWGGFWVTPHVEKRIREGDTIEACLRGNGYDRNAIWPGLSLAASAVVTAFALLGLMACGTTALSVASSAVQVALTNKAAREVFSTSAVPGLTPPPSPR
jgi:hypothetical protein